MWSRTSAAEVSTAPPLDERGGTGCRNLVSSSGRQRALRAWALSFVAYAVYYVGRKGFSVAKKTLARDEGVSESALGGIDSAYLGAYALSQFASGVLGDRFGARRLVSFGLLGSALACAAFGSLRGALALGLAYSVNGWFQATGWPGTTRVMAEFTTSENRGTVMAFWSTCYQLGGVGANLLCGFLLVRFGWRSAFWVPALVLASTAALIWFGLPERVDQARLATTLPETQDGRARIAAAQRELLKHAELWCFGASYFFIKFIRYALLFWLPYFLSTRLGYRADLAASVASAFEFGGMAGVIVIGIVSDRTRRLSRAALSALSLLGLAAALFAYASSADASVATNVCLLAGIGALLFGPDALLSGAAAQDAGGERAAAMAAGMVNGIGSLGAIFEGLVVPRISRGWGWEALFPVLVVLALAAAAALAPALIIAKARPPVVPRN